VDEVSVGAEGIRLGQLLKLAGLVDSGADAKSLLQAGAVQVNGEVDTRRGRQLKPGDVVRLGEQSVRVT
jgi:ribosome-associated protein